MRLIIDGNSYLNASLLRGTDHDDGRIVTDPETGKQTQVNGAEYGVAGFWEKVSDDVTKFGIAPRDIIVVWDGKNAKNRRRQIIARYKEGRDKIEEVSAQLNLARDIVIEMTRDIGATTMQQKGVEGDDVIGYLCKKLPGRKVVGTADGDLSVLVDATPGNVTDVWRLGEMSKNPYGPFPHRFITLFKSLVGDSGDKIPGAPGFGDTKFVDLVRAFGVDGLEMMEGLILTDKLHTLAEDVAEFKPLQKIIDGKDSVATSWRCASLHIDDVNTLHGPLEIIAGLVKPWATLADDRRVSTMKSFYATSTLVTAANYAAARQSFAARIPETPFFPLDIETSSSEASDEYVTGLMKAMDKKDSEGKVDTLGHDLTGMSITFGLNLQHTIYMAVDHKETLTDKNITVDQCREVVDLIPEAKHIVIHNRSFEFNVLHRAFKDSWALNGWGGFVPNAIDTVIGGSYVDENLPKGLKARSLHHLGYTQQTYDETTTKTGPIGKYSGGAVSTVFEHVLVPAVTEPGPVKVKAGVEVAGKPVIVTPAVTEAWETRSYKMNELTGAEVLGYGCDDTVCTGALHTHFKMVMEIEKTWDVYIEVEQRPQYLTSLAYTQGVKISASKLRDMEKTDDARFDKNWAVVRDYLLKKGWEGTVCPEFEAPLEASDIKLAAEILVPEGEFVTKVRMVPKVASELRAQFPDNAKAHLLAGFAEAGDVEAINKMLADAFDGEPVIKFNSPKQLQNLFYNVLGMTPRVFNKLTDKQREDPDMAKAFRRLKSWQQGKLLDAEVTSEERAMWISKASTDDDLVEYSLARDTLTDEKRAVITAYQVVRKVMTRRSLFYKTYRAIPHFRTGRVHSSMNQCEAVTRRYSSSGPNLQQQPKLGDGAEFRETVVPHCKDGVIISCDFSGQELRLMAHYSGDVNLTACYVGDNLKDVHSLTAVAASIYLWDEAVTYEGFIPMLVSKDSAEKDKAKQLRGDAKTVNFGTQYDMAAAALSIKLKVDEDIAQKFIDAKDAAFPNVEIWKESVRNQIERDGFSTTLMGARRHLQAVLTSDDRYERSRADRQGPNFKIQGSGAEQSKLSMGQMWDEKIFLGRFNAQFIAPIHDECVSSCHKDDALEFIKVFHQCMTRPYGGMTIPIVSSISLGLNFGQQIEVGDTYDPVAIQAALDKIFSKEAVPA